MAVNLGKINLAPDNGILRVPARSTKIPAVAPSTTPVGEASSWSIIACGRLASAVTIIPSDMIIACLLMIQSEWDQIRVPSQCSKDIPKQEIDCTGDSQRCCSKSLTPTLQTELKYSNPCFFFF
mmetsp:Transcript_32790/g.68382  ORF Transcript_32790/g.68382 Transcript_32790/m.68382 type:complete len:124 (-) Transcript_32790:149-520(-)